ncbi:LysR substrate-binding domain-containing protein [Azospirillum melinis]|uniref:LysR substrate-binding domain-containing protein n=1 Tax=Azospirillum melinis TaxID=328839 RepID=UPI003757DD87
MPSGSFNVKAGALSPALSARPAASEAISSAVARRIASGGRSVVATPAYLARAGVPRTPADLADHDAVVYSQLSNGWAFRQGGTEASVVVCGRLRVSAAEGIRAAGQRQGARLCGVRRGDRDWRWRAG